MLDSHSMKGSREKECGKGKRGNTHSPPGHPSLQMFHTPGIPCSALRFRISGDGTPSYSPYSHSRIESVTSTSAGQGLLASAPVPKSVAGGPRGGQGRAFVGRRFRSSKVRWARWRGETYLWFGLAFGPFLLCIVEAQAGEGREGVQER